MYMYKFICVCIYDLPFQGQTGVRLAVAKSEAAFTLTRAISFMYII